MAGSTSSAGAASSRLSSPRVSKAKLKPTACRRCHSRKVKCPGGQPCRACARSGHSEDCTYPDRDRLVKISQKYIDELLAENERLRRAGQVADAETQSRRVRPAEDAAEAASGAASGAAPSANTGPLPAGGQNVTLRDNGPTRNPLFDDRPWFLNVSTSNDPILIGEAAESAFMTRFRQTLSGTQLNHLPRTAYPSDEAIRALAASYCPLPSPERARFLMMAALRTVAGRYCIVSHSAALESLEKLLADPSESSTGAIASSKVWALLALGEVYSTRMASPEQTFPGLAYFSRASQMLHILQERPAMDQVETFLLMSMYSLSANRRRTAYCLAGYAVRHAAVIGLHLEIPETQLGDRLVREQRRRLWWSAYEFDRQLSTSLGQPAAIEDDRIHVDLPSDCGSPAWGGDYFTDAEYLRARISLTKMAARVTKSLYGRSSQEEPFSYRVQQALKDLQGWVHNLPDFLQLDRQSSSSQPTPERTRSLHLAFNQSVVVATRPVLLYALGTYKDAWQNPSASSEPQMPENVQALAGACIRCAKHTYRLLMEAWVDGAFTAFDYLHTQYLFSTATILALSSLLNGPSSVQDGQDFEHATELLSELKRSGSPAANEFCLHISYLKENMRGLDRGRDGASTTSYREMAVPAVYPAFGASYTTPFMTAEMALAEPSLQAFLTQTDFNLQMMDRTFFDNASTGFYLGP